MIISLTIQTLGAGFLYTTRSVVTTMIQRDQTARLYTAIEITQAFGMILAGPVMTFVFQWGLHIEGIWLGLPWMLATTLFAIMAVVILWGVRLSPRAKDVEQVDDCFTTSS
jgi:MFS family permease